MNRLTAIFLALVLAAAAHAAAANDEAGVYLETEDFLAQSFPEGVPAPKALWVTGELKERVRAVLGHDLGRLRVRYWASGPRTAWILDEIGKTEPISVGIVVDAGQIEDVKILAFRESRGWEVRYPFFTDQFSGVGLTDKDRLDGRVDGISGATLSVRAVKRVVAAALLLSERVVSSDG